MKRRVALVRALLADYDLLLLDEPFKGLDQETKEGVIAFTRKMTTGKTVLLVTHDEREAQLMGSVSTVTLP
jgi:NitT/TauT family transport system ATP-binding protein